MLKICNNTGSLKRISIYGCGKELQINNSIKMKSEQISTSCKNCINKSKRENRKTIIETYIKRRLTY